MIIGKPFSLESRRRSQETKKVSRSAWTICLLLFNCIVLYISYFLNRIFFFHRILLQPPVASAPNGQEWAPLLFTFYLFLKEFTCSSYLLGCLDQKSKSRAQRLMNAFRNLTLVSKSSLAFQNWKTTVTASVKRTRCAQTSFHRKANPATLFFKIIDRNGARQSSREVVALVV